MTFEQRVAERDAARERIEIGQQEVHSATVDQARACLYFHIEDEDEALATYEARAYLNQYEPARGYELLGTEQSRRAAVAANQQLGSHVFRAVECEYLNRLHSAGLDDGHVEQEHERRADEHPRAGQLLRYLRSLEGGEDKTFDRLANWSHIHLRKSRGEEVRESIVQRAGAPITDDEFRGIISRAFDPELYSDDEIRNRLYQRRIDAYDIGEGPHPDDLPAWPQNDRERFTLYSTIRGSLFFEGQTHLRDVTARLNNERYEIFRQSLRDELGRVQSFGGEHVEIKGTNSSFSTKDRSMFDTAVSMYPDQMVAVADTIQPGLVVRKSTRRAFFQRDGLVEYQTKTRPTYALSLRNLEYDTEDDYRIEHLADEFTSETPNAGDFSAAPVDTPEHRRAVQGLLDRHNEGSSVLSVSSLAASSRRSRTRPKLVMETITNPETGQDHLVARADRPVSRTRMVFAPNMTTNGAEGTTIHEVGHYMEADPRVNQVCKQFLYDRTAGLESQVYHRSRKFGTEYATGDGFINTYVGKDYPDQRSTEVFTVGMEAIFARDGTGQNGVGRPDRIGMDGSRELAESASVQDPEHRDLILGILAGFRTAKGKPLSLDRAKEINDDHLRNYYERRDLWYGDTETSVER